MINMTPETPCEKTIDKKKRTSTSKDKDSLKPKKTANSIKKEKASKAQKPNSAKKSPAFGNIKSMFNKMSKPKIVTPVQDKEEEKKEEPTVAIADSPVKQEFIIPPMDIEDKESIKSEK